jgi:hypothetical protein
MPILPPETRSWQEDLRWMSPGFLPWKGVPA